MNSKLKYQLETQLTGVVKVFEEARSSSAHDDLSDLRHTDIQRLTTAARAAILRIGGKDSAYAKQMDEILKSKWYESAKALQLLGVVEALLSDVKAGYLGTVAELIHGEVFGDFLEMAEHLLDGGYKDAAAVIAGATLESHLRRMCQKNAIPLEVSTTTGFRPRKADQMNSDLTSIGIYSKLDQKNVTAWLDLRNKAAHGKFSEYQKEQVSLLIAGVRDFITRNPA
jgi:hypothetical protein